MSGSQNQLDARTAQARSRLGALGLTLCLWLAASSASATTLVYHAHLAGLKVGRAMVVVESAGHRYGIRGDASVKGVARVLSDWRSEFYASGRWVHGVPELIEYGYDERERHKTRVLTIRDGQVSSIKNGETRPPHPVLDGMDVLTAFFLQPACWTSKLVHTGRYNYRIEGRPSSRQGGCYYQVEDEDGDRVRVHVVYEEHLGLLVPARLTTHGLLRGRIELIEARGAESAGSGDRPTIAN